MTEEIDNLLSEMRQLQASQPDLQKSAETGSVAGARQHLETLRGYMKQRAELDAALDRVLETGKMLDKLDELATSAAHGSYPTADCLSVDEVEAYCVRRELPEERLAHLGACSACNLLVRDAMVPDRHAAMEHIARLRKIASQAPEPAKAATAQVPEPATA